MRTVSLRKDRQEEVKEYDETDGVQCIYYNVRSIVGKADEL